jgi:putative membrane protein
MVIRASAAGGLVDVPSPGKNGSVPAPRIEFPVSRPVLSDVVRFLVRTVATAIGLWVADALISGITVSGSSGWTSALTLFAVAVIFGVVNAVLKPVIKVLGCLFYIVTFWLIAFVVNALLFLFVSWLAGVLDLPFHVQGFWSAFWGAIIVSIVSWAISMFLPEGERRFQIRRWDVGR